MPHLLITDNAAFDLKRLYKFLQQKNKTAARRMLSTVVEAIDRLAVSPLLGAPCGQYRRLVISFGTYSYLAYYEYDAHYDRVKILWIQHSREDIDHPEHGMGELEN